jgi:hypothetical protein
MKIKPIERINQPTIKEFNQYISQNQPVIITGVANQWQAYYHWTSESFKQMFGDLTVPLRASDNEIDVFFGEDKQEQFLWFSEYIDLISNGNFCDKRPPYFGNIFLNDPEIKYKICSRTNY